MLTFYANDSGNPGSSTLHPVEGAAYEHRFHVGVSTAKSVSDAGMAPPPDILLVDAEGAEAEIMAGFGAHLSRPALRRVVFEAPNNFLEARQPAILHGLVINAGFVVEPLIRRENTAHSLSNFLGQRFPS